jgi:hypothetical protein
VKKPQAVTKGTIFFNGVKIADVTDISFKTNNTKPKKAKRKKMAAKPSPNHVDNDGMEMISADEPCRRAHGAGEDVDGGARVKAPPERIDVDTVDSEAAAAGLTCADCSRPLPLDAVVYVRAGDVRCFPCGRRDADEPVERRPSLRHQGAVGQAGI